VAAAGQGAPAPEGTLGLVAGGGALPRLIAEDRRRRGLETFVVRFEGVEAPWADAFPHADLAFEKPGRLFAALRAAGCTEVCFAGAMSRPRLDPLRFDLKALSLLARVPALLRQGDDAMLRGFADILAEEGFPLVAPHEQLESLLAPDGRLAGPEPDPALRADAARAAEIAAALGALDVGQAAVVADGLCLGVEALGGTDALLAAVAALPPRVRPAAPGALWKGPKPGQDWRMDLPAIGPETVRRAAAAGLGGIRLHARGVLILGPEETAAAAETAGLALWAEP